MDLKTVWRFVKGSEFERQCETPLRLVDSDLLDIGDYLSLILLPLLAHCSGQLLQLRPQLGQTGGRLLGHLGGRTAPRTPGW